MMFGGIQGVGASEAWYATAVDVEWAMTFNIPIIGGALDFYKCFDQILRPLLYAVLRLSGIPERVPLISVIRRICTYITRYMGRLADHTNTLRASPRDAPFLWFSLRSC